MGQARIPIAGSDDVAAVICQKETFQLEFLSQLGELLTEQLQLSIIQKSVPILAWRPLAKKVEGEGRAPNRSSRAIMSATVRRASKDLPSTTVLASAIRPALACKAETCRVVSWSRRQTPSSEITTTHNRSTVPAISVMRRSRELARTGVDPPGNGVVFKNCSSRRYAASSLPLEFDTASQPSVEAGGSSPKQTRSRASVNTVSTPRSKSLCASSGSLTT